MTIININEQRTSNSYCHAISRLQLNCFKDYVFIIRQPTTIPPVRGLKNIIIKYSPYHANNWFYIKCLNVQSF